jgi:hypothetical protein
MVKYTCKKDKNIISFCSNITETSVGSHWEKPSIFR